MGPVSVAFGRRLRELRLQRGWSQERLADRAGIHHTAVGRLERGMREPRAATIQRLARGLGVSPGPLLEEPGTDAER
jgi:transcriptional regulator with XRE-family HTH domain